MSDDVDLRFGLRLRAARLAKDLTQQDVADRAGLSRTSIVNLEAGQQAPSLTSLYAIAQALGVPAGSLLDQEPDKENDWLWASLTEWRDRATRAEAQVAAVRATLRRLAEEEE